MNPVCIVDERSSDAVCCVAVSKAGRAPIGCWPLSLTAVNVIRSLGLFAAVIGLVFGFLKRLVVGQHAIHLHDVKLTHSSVIYGNAVASGYSPKLVFVEEAGAEQSPELTSKLAAKKVVRYNVDGRIQQHKKVSHFVESEATFRVGDELIEGIDHP